MNWYTLAKTASVQLYHGTAAEFDSFNLSHAGQRDYGDFGLGVYLTPKGRLALMYAYDAAKRTGGQPVVYKVIASVTNTADMDNPQVVQQVAQRSGAPFPKRTNVIDGKQTRPQAESQSIADTLREMGYDSATGQHGAEFVVFDPSKVRIIGRANPDLL